MRHVRIARRRDGSGSKLNRSHTLRPSQFFGRTLLPIFASLACSFLINVPAHAQWRRLTPRDTIYVPANKIAWTQTNLNSPEYTQTEFSIHGTFGIFPNQNSAGFDARYMYSDPSWNGPLPLPNPPSWNGTTEQVYLQISNDNLYPDGDSIHVIESGYQASHQYTALYPGVGDYFHFRIFDRNNQDSTGADYALATGGLTITSAQYTAGVSVQHYSLTFPLTTVGMSSQLADSIASFGLDPLRVDSMWLTGPEQNEFSVYSSPAPFTLPNESAHVFSISYAPTAPDPLSTATLNVRCVNTGTSPQSDTEVIRIVLNGSGAKPNGTIIQDTLDFGTQRVNVLTKSKSISGYNSGNANFIIDSVVITRSGPNYYSDTDFFCTSKMPFTGYPESPFGISFSFDPHAPQPYQATAMLYTHDGKRIPVTLLGNGAQPRFTVAEDTLNFDTVLTNYSKVRYDTVRNAGGWPAVITGVVLGGQQRQFYTFQPAGDTAGFVLNPGESRIYTVTFHPKWGTDEREVGYLEFNFDDHSTQSFITLNGNERQPRIRYDTNVINFGVVQVGHAAYMPDGVINSSGNWLPYTPIVSAPFSDTSKPEIFAPDTGAIVLAFKPTVHGSATGWLVMSIPSEGQVDSILLLGFGAVAGPVFIPPSINFGVDFDGTSYFGATRLTDTGDYPLSICDAKIVGPDASEFTLGALSHPFPDTILDSSRNSLTFPITFMTTAREGRKHHATLVVTYCDGTTDSIPLVASEADEFVQFCSSSVDFGKIRVGTKGDTAICFQSTANNVFLSTGPIWITTAGLPFILAQDSVRVPPNASAFDSVSFIPTKRGAFTGYVHAGGGSNAGMIEDSIPITGIGVQSAAVLSAHQIDFGTIALLDTSGAHALFLSDTGDYPLGVQLEKIEDPSNEFLVVTQFGDTVSPLALDTVPADDSIFYSVKFTPRHPQLPDHESRLVFNYDDGTSDTVLLIGRDTASFLAFDRDTIDFGRVRLGTGALSAPLALVNTSSRNLTGSSISMPSAPFSVAPNAPITVTSKSTTPMTVRFLPAGIGNFTDSIRGIGTPFNDSLWNSVVLIGAGAAPNPKLSVPGSISDTLDFDIVAVGRSVTRNFTLSNLGNWPLVISRSPVTGPNSGDFTPQSIPTDTTIADSEQSVYSVTFLASTPLQQGPRMGYITWTEDNGDTLRLVLRAYDEPPIPIHLGFPHAYWGRPGDRLAVELELLSSVPDSLGIDSVHGTITFDPSIVEGPDSTGGVQPGSLVPTPNWKTAIHFLAPGSFTYDIYSTTNTLSKAGTLLSFVLQLHANLKDGASSPLVANDTIPKTSEVFANTAHTSVFLDSSCGTIHLLSDGEPIANYIQQNTPNPFGAVSTGHGQPSTALPFAIGADNTIVTIRILDATGREILRPVDRQPFARGRYQEVINAAALSPGIYFYEFRAGDDPPQLGKMAVE